MRQLHKRAAAVAPNANAEENHRDQDAHLVNKAEGT
jgi:hypothetical protein